MSVTQLNAKGLWSASHPIVPTYMLAVPCCREGRKFKELENQRTEVSWGMESLAGLWASTAEAAKEFPEHSPLVRQVVWGLVSPVAARQQQHGQPRASFALLWPLSRGSEGGSNMPMRAPHRRRAVGLGRLALDPLAVLAALCGPGFEVASLRLHDCQDKLPSAELQRVVEQVGCPAG